MLPKAGWDYLCRKIREKDLQQLTLPGTLALGETDTEEDTTIVEKQTKQEVLCESEDDS